MAPLITTTVAATREAVAQAKGRGMRVGFVPTMGALHEGHASLIRAARAECGFVVVSIFVNPAQFGPQEDLARYPRPFEQDVALCAQAGVALVFHPQPQVIYPPGYKTRVEVRELQDVLCGTSRPGHFGGVATVVLKLFNIVQPDLAYFGQKDAQQARILEQMIEDLNLPVTMRICPIVRADDGLALSSRNVYLSVEERQHATVLFRALTDVHRRVDAGERSAAALTQCAADLVAGTPGARLDYAAVVDWRTLRTLDVVSGQVLIALAVYFGPTRLIDNVLLEVKD
ncbi:MAG: pantoate--beta-alanine ligase [Gemmataceae bacterium]|nr:pantoate--beta-alanine ligase [Gemmataceae bacterium]MCI0738162.1 pantoate--beta-alanine ligase [Gemmataceae bacterium]